MGRGVRFLISNKKSIVAILLNYPRKVSDALTLIINQLSEVLDSVEQALNIMLVVLNKTVNNVLTVQISGLTISIDANQIEKDLDLILPLLKKINCGIYGEGDWDYNDEALIRSYVSKFIGHITMYDGEMNMSVDIDENGKAKFKVEGDYSVDLFTLVNSIVSNLQ